MSDTIATEFSSFLRHLMYEHELRFFDTAKDLMRLVKSSAETGLSSQARQERIVRLSDFCRKLIRDMENDRASNLRYRIPLSIREFSLTTIDEKVKLRLLGEFELAVRRYENPDAGRGRWPTGSASTS